MSKIGSVLTVQDSSGLITTPSVGAGSFATAAVDGTGITVNGSTGKLELQTAGALLANGVQRDEMSKFAGMTIKGALVASDAANGVMSEQNTYGTDLVVEVDVLVVTASTGACTLDFGVGALGSTHDNLLDDIDVNAPASATVFTSLDSTDAGANGNARYLWPSTGYVTGSMKTGATAGLVGTYLIRAIDMN